MREITKEVKHILSAEVLNILENSIEREALFFDRHGIIASQIDPESEAYGAYQRACDIEVKESSGNGRVFLHSPLGRKCFMLGYLVRDTAQIIDSATSNAFIDRVSENSGC